MELAKMIESPRLKIEGCDFEIEYEVEISSEEQVTEGSRGVDDRLSQNDKEIEELDQEIDRLTSHTDGLDDRVAVGSGIVAGIIDSLWVGEFSFERGKDWGSEKVNNFVKKAAEKQGYKGKDLEGAIKHLEDKFGAPSDSVTGKFGGGLQHHLRDFAHHPTPVGLLFSMLTQFTSKSYGTDTKGFFQVIDVENQAFVGKNVPEKFLFGTVFWFFHMVSDMAGTSTNSGAGTGLPGPILSLLKEVSALPFFKSLNKDDSKEFSVWISKLFNGTLLSEHDEKGKIIKESAELMRFDLRAELGIAHEIGRQAVPVILNECIVRGFYFIRRLALEMQEKNITQISELKRIDWNNVKPAKNRTIVRMLTISTGTFTAVDLADAAIRAGIKSVGDPTLFASQFLLRVNFVGVGRFAVAVGTDVYMGGRRESLRNERIQILSQQLHLLNAKVFYLQAGMWKEAEATERTINEALLLGEKSAEFRAMSWDENRKSMRNIGDALHKAEEKNPNLKTGILDTLKWGRKI
jgi:hypothetical protein